MQLSVWRLNKCGACLAYKTLYIIVHHNYDAPTLSPTHSCIYFHSNWSKWFLNQSQESHAYWLDWPVVRCLEQLVPCKVKGDCCVMWIRAPWSFNQSYMAFHAFHSPLSSLLIFHMTLKPLSFPFTLTLTLSQNQIGVATL